MIRTIVGAGLLVGFVFAQKLPPIDDAARNPEFQGFVKKLKSVVAKREVKGLKKLLDDDVVAFAEGKKEEKGWVAFQKHWRPAEAGSEVWEVLADFCDFGFVSLHPTVFVSPYFAWKFPRDLDPRRALVVTRAGVPLRERADREGGVLATLEFDIVERVGTAAGSGSLWERVRTGKGVEGFVLRQHLRSPLTARGQFAKKQGRWVVTALER
jgi:hypothetical protein